MRPLKFWIFAACKIIVLVASVDGVILLLGFISQEGARSTPLPSTGHWAFLTLSSDVEVAAVFFSKNGGPLREPLTVPLVAIYGDCSTTGFS